MSHYLAYVRGWRGPGWTYFIEGADRIKIGSTYRRPEERLSVLQTGSPVPLRLIGAISGAHHERDWHERFAHVRKHGEWFAATEHLLVSIREALEDCELVA